MDRRWYALEITPRYGASLQDQIEHELRLVAFMPTMRRIRPSHRRDASPFIALLPGYLFAAFDVVEERDKWPIIRRLPGVKQILGCSRNFGIPMPIPAGEIEHLQAIAEEKSKEISLQNSLRGPLAVGTFVHILWGPLEGWVGTIDVDKGKRVDILLRIAGVNRVVDVSRDLVEATA